MKKDADWKDWCKSNDILIKESGIPEGIVDDFASWEEFLLSNNYVDFNIKQLTVLQKIALLRLIETRPIDLRTHVARLLIDSLLETLEKLMRVNPDKFSQ